MTWLPLTTLREVEELFQSSYSVPCLIFKHSTRCNISFLAKNRLESGWDLPESSVETYIVDVLLHRNVSSNLALRFSVPHESPQIILLKDGECLLDASHLDIRIDEIKEQLNYGKIFR